MQRLFITVINCALLVIAFIGAPEVAGARFSNWQISSIPAEQKLTLWALAFTAVGDAGTALFLIKGRKERKLCWEWALIFTALFVAESAFIRGWINFDWLKQIPPWFQKRF
jgi:hypothetical protein